MLRGLAGARVAGPFAALEQSLLGSGRSTRSKDHSAFRIPHWAHAPGTGFRRRGSGSVLRAARGGRRRLVSIVNTPHAGWLEELIALARHNFIMNTTLQLGGMWEEGPTETLWLWFLPIATGAPESVLPQL